MGLRAYFLIELKKDSGEEEKSRALKDLAAMDGVDFVDAVTGEADMVAMVESATSVDEVAKKVREHGSVVDVKVLRVLGEVGAREASKSEFEK